MSPGCPVAPRVRSAVVIVLTLLTTTLLGAPKVLPPSPSEGVINGKQAVMFWPVSFDTQEHISPQDCTVHLVSEKEVDRELLYPCGKWFQPPHAGGYGSWLEQGNTIAPNQSRLVYGDGAANQGLIASTLMIPAGFVKLQAAANPAGASFRLVSLDSMNAGFERRAPMGGTASLRMPIGRAIAGLFDARGEALALSRPFSVLEGESVEVSPRAPRKGADVLAVLRKPSGSREGSPAKLSLRTGTSERAPDVLRETSTRIFAVWYEVPGDTATISLASDRLRFDGPSTLRLQNGRIATVRAWLASAAPKAAPAKP